MTRKHAIRVPNRPRGESAQVTIGNQDKQIKLLIDRIAELEGVKEKFNVALETEDDLCHRLDDANLAYARLRGWQDCAREVIGIIGPMIAPGA